MHADYRDLELVLDGRGIARIAGALADLGVSSMQLGAEGRGFSFQRDEPLDMRMDRSRAPTAADLLADVDEEELANVIFQYGEERYSRRIARAIVAGPARRRRSRRRASSRRSSGGRFRCAAISASIPATRTFQALRIRVNRELEGLDTFLGAAARRLMAGGRLAVIAFHSLEDRIVKHTFRALAHAETAHPDPDQAADRGRRRRGGTQSPGAQRQAARD